MVSNAKRVLTQPFVVVSALIEKDGKFLLIKENAPGHHAHGQWNLPGGWLEIGEDPAEAVKREVNEESGYDFFPSEILGIYSIVQKYLEKYFNAVPHVVKIVFLGKISENQGKFIEDEILETRFFSPEEIEKMDKNELRDTDIKKMIKDYTAGKKYPLEILNHTVL